MYRETVDAKQLGAWCFAAIVPTAIQLGSGASWLLMAVGCGICLGAVLLAKRWGCFQNRLFVTMRLIFLPILLAQLMRYASGSWPGDDRLFVPLAILAMAAWSAGKGARAAARAGSVLFWAVLLLYLIVLATGVRQVRLQWLWPEWCEIKWEALTVLLIPAVSAVLADQGQRLVRRLVLPTIFIVYGAAVSAGVLSPAVAGQASDAFYQLSRSLNLLGVAQRFEAVVSAGMTVGWFSLASLLLSVAGQEVGRLKPEWTRKGVYTAGVTAAGWLVLGLRLPPEIIVIGTGLLWVGIPVLEWAFSTIKGRKKGADSA